MSVTRLDDGLWQWASPHPEWREGADWDPAVGSVYVEMPEAIVLIDPLVPGGDEGVRFWRALDRDVARLGLPVCVLVTCAWHVRSAADVAGRYGARVWAPARDGDLDGVATERAVDGDVIAGITCVTVMIHPQPELCYWVSDYGALVVGDVLMTDAGGTLRVAPPDWYDGTEGERRWYRTELGGVLATIAAWEPRMILTGHGPPVLADATASLLRAAGAIRAD